MSLERTWHQREGQASRQSMGHPQCSLHASGTQAIFQDLSWVLLEACHSTDVTWTMAHLQSNHQDHVMSVNQTLRQRSVVSACTHTRLMAVN